MVMPDNAPKNPSHDPISPDLGLSDEVLSELVAKSIGVPVDKLPRRLLESLAVVGRYRAKQLAHELVKAVAHCRDAVRRMRIKLAYRDPTDNVWNLVQYEYSEVCIERELLRARIDEDCAAWDHYIKLVRPMHEVLEKFCGDVFRISQGYVPKSMRKPEDPDFENAPRLLDFTDKVDFYRRAIDEVGKQFPAWQIACGDFYREHCTLLEN